MEFSSPYWTDQQKVELLQRWILVHSYLYYELDYSIVEDHVFDSNCRQLVELSEAHPEALKNSRYYYAMEEFDGSTGAGFTSKLRLYDFDCITRDAYYLFQKRK